MERVAEERLPRLPSVRRPGFVLDVADDVVEDDGLPHIWNCLHGVLPNISSVLYRVNAFKGIGDHVNFSGTLSGLPRYEGGAEPHF